MKPKQIVRIAVDIAMTGFLLLLMAFMLTGQKAHEWFGTAELVLFIAHHVLNAGWLKQTGHGKYTPFRSMQTVLAVLVLQTMFGSMVSGIIMSRYAFSFLNIYGGMSLARRVHMICAYWGFLFLSAHLGLHWSMIMGMVRKVAAVKEPSVMRAVILRVLVLLITGNGVYAFFKNQIADYLLLKSQFVFFDFSQPPMQFLVEYLSMMCMFAALSYYLSRALQRAMKRKEKS